MNAYKLHTNTFARLVGVIQKAMFGITKKTFTTIMPHEFYNMQEGEIVFISELDVIDNVLFGPFYIVKKREGIKGIHHGVWIEIDEQNSSQDELAYWINIERYNYCLLFDKLLAQNISIIQPYHWRELNVHLPSWGKIEPGDAEKLVEFSLKHEHQQEAKEFLRNHGVF